MRQRYEVLKLCFHGFPYLGVIHNQDQCHVLAAEFEVSFLGLKDEG